MKISELIFFFVFGAIGILIITSMFRDWLRKRRITRTLSSRSQNDDDAFRKLFVTPGQADIAVRTRRVLSDNLKLPLHGLVPTDRLNDDLNTELAANPHLFWDLEREFEIKTDVEDIEAHEKTLNRLGTFQDLVEYIEGRITARATEPPVVEPEEEKPSRVYALAIRSIPFLCVGGLLTAMVGIVAPKDAGAKFNRLINLGFLLFGCGIATWGLANGGETLRGVVKSLRGQSWQEIKARPWPLILVTLVAVIFLWFGGSMAWLVVRKVWLAR